MGFIEVFLDCPVVSKSSFHILLALPIAGGGTTRRPCQSDSSRRFVVTSERLCLFTLQAIAQDRNARRVESRRIPPDIISRMHDRIEQPSQVIFFAMRDSFFSAGRSVCAFGTERVSINESVVVRHDRVTRKHDTTGGLGTRQIYHGRRIEGACNVLARCLECNCRGEGDPGDFFSFCVPFFFYTRYLLTRICCKMGPSGCAFFFCAYRQKTDIQR